MISAKRVQEIATACMFQESEVKTGRTVMTPRIGQGIVHNFGFHPERLEAHREEVADLIREIASAFTDGGGWSFLNMNLDRHGHHWGDRQDAEVLLALADALGMADISTRAIWPSLTGGMPYVHFTLPQKGAKT